VAAPATGLGAAASNLMTGYVVMAAGFDLGFLTLAAIAGDEARSKISATPVPAVPIIP
jgi:hypothetical protein